MALNIKVRFLGVFRGIARKTHVAMAVEESADVGRVVQRLVEVFPPEFERVLIDPELGDPRPNALILVNGTEISALRGLETEVKDGDEIVLVPVSHGG